MSRWLIVFAALMVCAMVSLVAGKDVAPFIAVSFIALALADEEREFEDMDDE